MGLVLEMGHPPKEAQFPWEIVGRYRTSDQGQQGL